MAQSEPQKPDGDVARDRLKNRCVSLANSGSSFPSSLVATEFNLSPTPKRGLASVAENHRCRSLA